MESPQAEVQPEKRAHVPRAPRVSIPLLASFNSHAFAVREYTLNLSESGVFLPGTEICPVGTRGKLTFRTSQFDDPFTLDAVVVRAVEPGSELEGQESGMGLQFLDLGERELGLLRRLVEGITTGSITEAIRRTIRESSRTLDQELRRRPIDQKLILAQHASSEEIQALLRDGNPTVLQRLLGSPRTTSAHVLAMVRSPNTPTRVLSSIHRDRKWISVPEIRRQFVLHPNTMLSEAMTQIRFLTPDQLKTVQRDMRIKRQLRLRAQELLKKVGQSR